MSPKARACTAVGSKGRSAPILEDENLLSAFFVCSRPLSHWTVSPMLRAELSPSPVLLKYC